MGGAVRRPGGAAAGGGMGGEDAGLGAVAAAADGAVAPGAGAQRLHLPAAQRRPQGHGEAGRGGPR